MNLSDYLYLAFTSLKEKKGRAAGAALGVMIAVLALSLALGVGESFQKAFVEQLQSTIAADSVFVIGGYAGLTDADIAYFKSIPGVKDAQGVLMASGVVYTESGEKPVNIVAVDPSFLPRYLGVSDMRKAVAEGETEPRGLGVLVSYSLWRDQETGRKLLDVGSVLNVRVGGRNVQVFVVGLLEQTSSSMSMGHDFQVATIYMDPDAFFTYLGRTRNYPVAIVLVENLDALDSITENIRALAPPGSRIISAAAMVKQFTSLVGALQLFIALISAVGMGVTALWIFDSTTISVTQRTKEIGILKALGYTSGDILAVFLLETVIVSLVGAAAGLLAALASSSVVKISAFGIQIGVALTPHTAGLAVLLPLAANVLAAFIPARRGASLNPVEALRYE
ncbi:ABC transporter permease [Thermofilum pendens]|uniref:ABC transporter permease n=1 Tax=Thermofilum pendens (strain DSM 2475 / Hrk 5) TaxID=368408 RepID=A1S020_THEPD|nr:FtsX-like permease family protein [Thermofilum pendens]ABL78800.1 protein of unknown function DUF214 [Thermofilum pendens Hrk 5]